MSWEGLGESGCRIIAERLFPLQVHHATALGLAATRGLKLDKCQKLKVVHSTTVVLFKLFTILHSRVPVMAQ